MKARYHALLAGAFILLFAKVESAPGATIIEVAALDLQTDQLGTLIPTSALIQFVNLGADGVLNQIVLNDGGSQWVSGDDSLLSLSFANTEGANTDHFDVAEGAGDPGYLQRTFDLSAVPAGTKLGIRWFPSVAATAYDAAGTALAQQVAYGQFTRQGPPLNAEGDPSVIAWIVPPSSVGVQSFRFDPLATVSQSGNDPNADGVASFSIVPEPSAAAFLALGCGAMLARRRR